MADQQKAPTGDDVAAKVREAGELRIKLEKLSNQGLFDLTKPEIRAAHERLDALERFVYLARAAR